MKLILTIRLVKGKNTPIRNIVIAGAAQADLNVIVICIIVPPIMLATNPRHMDTTPITATLVEEKYIDSSQCKIGFAQHLWKIFF